MEYRRLGRSGLIVSAVGLGANNFGGRTDEQGSFHVLDQILESGVNFIDTSNTYNSTRSEQIIGKWLKGKRNQVILATKFGKPVGKGPYQMGTSRKHLMEQVEASLQRLQTDHIDLYQVHQPDPLTPIEETLRGLDDLVGQGKVRYIGTSNFASWQICEAAWTARDLGLNRFISEQPYYNLLRRGAEKEIIPVCEQYGIGVIPYYPLESGILTGKYQRGAEPDPSTRMGKQSPEARRMFMTERNFDIVAKLQKFAEARGKAVGDLAIAWLLRKPVVGSVIAGATRPEQVIANARGADWKLTPEEIKEIDAISPPD